MDIVPGPCRRSVPLDALNTVPVVVANDASLSLRNLVRELRDKELALLVRLASLRAGEPERSNQRWWVDFQLESLLSAWAELPLWAREAQLERGETERAAEEAKPAMKFLHHSLLRNDFKRRERRTLGPLTLRGGISTISNKI